MSAFVICDRYFFIIDLRMNSAIESFLYPIKAKYNYNKIIESD